MLKKKKKKTKCNYSPWFWPIGGDCCWKTMNEAVWKHLYGQPALAAPTEAKDSICFWSATHHDAWPTHQIWFGLESTSSLKLFIEFTEWGDGVGFLLTAVWQLSCASMTAKGQRIRSLGSWEHNQNGMDELPAETKVSTLFLALILE